MLWAITSYFNPAGYRRRLHNYHVFRQRLDVPLVAVEWARAGDFQLNEKDADILVHVRGGDIMWQKERLLNVALGALPPECDTVAWLDCDVILGDEKWKEQAQDALQRAAVVHLCQEQFDLPSGAGPDVIPGWDREPTARSVVLQWVNGELDSSGHQPHPRHRIRTAWGFGWAAQRALLDRHGFYDRCIVGGGDYVVWAAAAGAFDHVGECLEMNEQRVQHYLDWAVPFHDEVGGRVEWLPGPLYHLWHGDLGDRQYLDRHKRMAEYQFDPAKDVEVTEEGCLRWASDKPGLHDYIEQYFRRRREDGKAPVGQPSHRTSTQPADLHS